MKQRLFKQVDVFSAEPYLGNPLAVVLDGTGLDDAAMQRFARWTNLSETTFLLPPTDSAADYRVRIFTPGGELPFAGHPTLGSCHAWLEAGGSPRASGAGGQPASPDFIVQECKVGPIRIRREAGSSRLAFAAPPLTRSTPAPARLAEVAAALGCPPAHILAAQLLDNGPVWLGLLLDSPETVLQLEPDHAALARLDAKVGVAAIYPTIDAPPLIARANREARAFTATACAARGLAGRGSRDASPLSPVQTCSSRFGAAGSSPSGAGLAWGGPARRPSDPDLDTPDLEVRAFAAPIGVNEDPVTGSLNASLAQWLIAEGHMPASYLASQGVCLGRAGLIHVARDAHGQVWIGGESVSCVDGRVLL